MFYAANYPSPVGRITLASDGEALVGLWIEGQKYFASTAGEMMFKEDLPVFNKAKLWLDRYFAGEKPASAELPLAPAGGEFRQRVWKALLDIPYGETMSYGEIARRLGNSSARAVGGAVGHNPISIIIPCHRVIGSNGSLTGYAGGIDKKVFLLEREGVDASKWKIPAKGTAL